MRHRLFHAIVVIGAATGCSSSDNDIYNPPRPEVDAADSGSDGSATTDTSQAQTDTSPSTADASGVSDTAARDAPASDAMTDAFCADEGCGCFPCIK